MRNALFVQNLLHHIRVGVLRQDHVNLVLVDAVDERMSLGASLAVVWPQSLWFGLVSVTLSGIGHVDVGLFGHGVQMHVRIGLVVFRQGIHGSNPEKESFHYKKLVDGLDKIEGAAFNLHISESAGVF